MAKMINNSVAQSFLKKVQQNSESIISLLSSQCTRHSALTEIKQAVETAIQLNEIGNSPSPARSSGGCVRVFLPRNNILYSIALYCVIPAALGYRVQARSPAALHGLLEKLWTLTGLEQQSRTSLFLGTQRNFTDQFCASDIVIFTGKSENGHKIDQSTKHKKFFGFGSSSNPFVINCDAKIEMSVNKLLQTRLYNSGADCLAPDVIYVHDAIINKFNNCLMDKLKSLNVTALNESDSFGLAPCPDETTACSVREIIAARRDDIIFTGAAVDLPNYVPPVVLRSELGEKPVDECFGPIFNTVSFRTIEDLVTVLRSPLHRGTEMYLSWFGSQEELAPKDFTLCSQTGPFEYDHPLSSFGGYGVNATWLSTSTGTNGQPLDVYGILGGEN